MVDEKTTVADLRREVEKFVHERKWRKFHNPKDLAISICLEAAELLELFQWLSQREVWRLARNPVARSKIGEELADIQIYLLCLANVLNFDVSQLVAEKLQRDRERYPAENFKGRAPTSADEKR
ncbi:MAG: nucleotide pyrophosphohydrolase [Candidatus Verstraetearchaeota archaeon]|nr:nucleotide pyrophosphohydrolase [Candidatus Verstraetearchaeota archaeon]